MNNNPSLSSSPPLMGLRRVRSSSLDNRDVGAPLGDKRSPLRPNSALFRHPSTIDLNGKIKRGSLPDPFPEVRSPPSEACSPEKQSTNRAVLIHEHLETIQAALSKLDPHDIQDTSQETSEVEIQIVDSLIQELDRRQSLKNLKVAVNYERSLLPENATNADVNGNAKKDTVNNFTVLASGIKLLLIKDKQTDSVAKASATEKSITQTIKQEIRLYSDELLEHALSYFTHSLKGKFLAIEENLKDHGMRAMMAELGMLPSHAEINILKKLFASNSASGYLEGGRNISESAEKRIANLRQADKQWAPIINERHTKGLEDLNNTLKKSQYQLNPDVPRYNSIEELIISKHKKIDLPESPNYDQENFAKFNTLFLRVPGGLHIETAGKLPEEHKIAILSGNEEEIENKKVLPIMMSITSSGHDSFTKFAEFLNHKDAAFADKFVFVATLTDLNSDSHITAENISNTLWSGAIFDIYLKNPSIRAAFKEALAKENATLFDKYENLGDIDNIIMRQYNELKASFAKAIPMQLGLVAIPKYMLTPLSEDVQKQE